MKRFLSVLLVLILCLQLLPVGSFAADEAGSPKHIPRVVSIVFDDSGSMYNETDRWAYTSYAMQAFAAMMGSEDVLYITYLNGASASVRVDLSDGAKASTVSGFTNIRFGGGTPDKIQQGADCLTRAYASYGASANYYLVVMTDGALDSGVIYDRVTAVNQNTKSKLKGAEFETIYFTMNAADKAIDGVKNYFATDTTKIADALKDVSAQIMGRTEVRHSVSGSKLTFDLTYPALSIAIIAQKGNRDFGSFRAAAQRDGKDFACQIGDYPIKSPTTINKDSWQSPWQEYFPVNPPSGVVSLISGGGAPLAKGSYTVDISGYDLKTDDIVVLVEPAVRIGCKYRINDSKDTVTFPELKNGLQEGDTVTVECGLYEMKADGSLGDPVSESVLSPVYKITVGGKEVGTSADKENTYQFQVTREFAEQDLRVQALLKGYQPFVMKETFGKFNIKIRPITLPVADLRLTKPVWQLWKEGKGTVAFQLEEMDDSVLSRTAILVEGCQGLPAGTCSQLGEAVRVEGNTIVYAPKAAVDFEQLPDRFTVSLKEIATGQILLQRTVQVIQPTYRLEVSNGLNGTALTLDQLRTNTAGIRFTVTADYDGSGVFFALAPWDAAMVEKLDINAGDLPGSTEIVYGGDGKPAGKLYIPQYDEHNNNGIPFTKVAGHIHTVTATLQNTDATAQTKVETVAPEYDLLVHKEGITVVDAALRNNTEGVEFIILRDGKKLTRLELEGMAPYPLSFDRYQPWMKLDAEVYTYPDGTSVLRCIPKYNGWRFPSASLWNWLTPVTVKKGDMHAVLTFGSDVARAAVTVQASPVAFVIFLIVCIILFLLGVRILCAVTRVRFLNGSFYVASFSLTADTQGYMVDNVSVFNPHRVLGKKGGLFKFLFSPQFWIPGNRQQFSVGVHENSALFITGERSSVFELFKRTYPYSVSKSNQEYFNVDQWSMDAVQAAVRWDDQYGFNIALLKGKPCAKDDKKMSPLTYLVEKGSDSIVFFVPKRDERNFRRAAKKRKKKSENIQTEGDWENE